VSAESDNNQWIRSKTELLIKDSVAKQSVDQQNRALKQRISSWTILSIIHRKSVSKLKNPLYQPNWWQGRHRDRYGIFICTKDCVTLVLLNEYAVHLFIRCFASPLLSCESGFLHWCRLGSGLSFYAAKFLLDGESPLLLTVPNTEVHKIII
jgi:hypothetical protein